MAENVGPEARSGKSLAPGWRNYLLVLSNRPFRNFAIGVGVSSLGDGIGLVAVPWLALTLASQSDRALYVGLALGAFYLPSLLPVMFLGRLRARFRARSLVLLDSYTRASFLGIIAVLALADQLTVQLYIALLAFSALFHAWGYGGRTTLVAELNKPAHLLSANSLLSSGQTLGLNIVGPSIGGIVVALWNAQGALALNALSFLILAGAVHTFRVRTAGRLEDSRPGRRASAMHLIVTTPRLGLLLAVTVIFYVVYGPVDVALPLFVVDDLHSSVSAYGLVEAGFGLGSVIGALVVGGRSRNIWPAIALIIMGWGASLILVALSTAPVHAIIGMTIGGLVYGPYTALANTVLQTSLTPAQLPIVATVWSGIIVASAPLASVLGGPLVGAAGARQALLGSGGITVLLGIACAALLVVDSRRRSSLP